MDRNVSNTGEQQQAAAITFLLGACWVAAALAAVRIVQRVAPTYLNPLATQLLALLVVSAGLYWIGLRRVHEVRPLSSIGFVVRPSQWEELGIGAALGWAVSIALVFPTVITLHLQSVVRLDAYHWQQCLVGILLLTANTLITQLVFTGLLFRSLVRATSPALATVCFSLLAAGILSLSHTADIWQLLFTALAQTVFSVAALRTRAIWLALGMQAAWGIMLQLFFGVSSFYWPGVAGIVQSFVTGPRVLTGAYLGPEASAWAFAVTLAAMVVLWRATRELAWHYTYEPITSAGYPMDVAPPKEHIRMQAEAPALVPSLVQIAPAAAAVGHAKEHVSHHLK